MSCHGSAMGRRVRVGRSVCVILTPEDVSVCLWSARVVFKCANRHGLVCGANCLSAAAELDLESARGQPFSRSHNSDLCDDVQHAHSSFDLFYLLIPFLYLKYLPFLLDQNSC